MLTIINKNNSNIDIKGYIDQFVDNINISLKKDPVKARPYTGSHYF